jgi:hypothetical protein
MPIGSPRFCFSRKRQRAPSAVSVELTAVFAVKPTLTAGACRYRVRAGIRPGARRAPIRYLSQALLQLARLHDARAGSIVPLSLNEQAQLQLARLQLALSGSTALLQLARLQEARV